MNKLSVLMPVYNEARTLRTILSNRCVSVTRYTNPYGGYARRGQRVLVKWV